MTRQETAAHGRHQAEVTIATWRGRVDEGAVAFARTVSAVACPAGPARARSLLWATSRLAAWGLSVGLELAPEVLLAPSVIERYVAVGMASVSASSRRTMRANLRFVARRAAPALGHPPSPPALARSRAKAPYTDAEIAAYFTLAGAQPTPGRRARLEGLLCLGLGAGLEGAELRGIAGACVVARSGGVVVEVGGRRARTVPVVVRYQAMLLASATFAGEGFICGGTSPGRKNVTSNLVGKLAGGADLPRLDVGRLRATWLAGHLERLGLVALLHAAGVVCSQRLGDLAAHIDPPDEAAMVELLGASL
ncbi:hypothetical protein BH24ACT1_BH24ACT1_05150 [soil metagenome]